MVLDSDHFQKDAKEHEWAELSWDSSTHVGLVHFDRTCKHTWNILYTYQCVIYHTSSFPVLSPFALHPLFKYITLCFRLIGLYFSIYGYRSITHKQRSLERRRMFLLRNILVTWHEIMDLSMLIILWLLQSRGSWTWEGVYIAVTLCILCGRGENWSSE